MRTILLFMISAILFSCSNPSNSVKENDVIYGVEAIDGVSFKAQNKDKTQTVNIRIFGINSPEEKLRDDAQIFLDSLIANKQIVIKKIYAEDKLTNSISADVWFVKDGEENYSDRLNLNPAMKLLIYGLAVYDESSKHELSSDFVNAQVLGMQKIRSDENKKAIKEAIDKGVGKSK